MGYGWNVSPRTTFASYTLTSSDFSSSTSLGNWIYFSGTGSPTFTLPATAPPAVTSCVLITGQLLGGASVTINPNGLNVDGSSSTFTLTKYQGVEICSDGTNYHQRGTSSLNGAGVASVGFTSPLTNTGTSSAVVGQLNNSAGNAVTNVVDDVYNSQTTVNLTGLGTGCASTVTVKTPSANTQYLCTFALAQTVADASCGTHGSVGLSLNWTDAASGQALSSTSNNVGLALGARHRLGRLPRTLTRRPRARSARPPSTPPSTPSRPMSKAERPSPTAPM